MRLCSIASGSSGNCIYVGSDKTSILVDAGISGKRIENGLHELELETRDMDAILVTHEHSDHIKGLGVLARRYEIPIYTTAGTKAALEQMTTLGKIPQGLIHTISPDLPFNIGDLTVKPFHIFHDAAEPVGYRIENEGKAAAVATDMGHYDDYIIDNLKNLDVVLLESNHDVHMLEVGSYPYYLKRRILGENGHLSNETAGQLLCQILHDNIREIFLGHLSHENNYEALAYETVCSEVTMGDNPYKSDDFKIAIAHRDSISEPVEF